MFDALSETRDTGAVVAIPTEFAGITGRLYLAAELLSFGDQTVGKRSQNGPPFWLWLLVGLGGVAMVGITAFLLRRRSARRVVSTPLQS